MVEVFAKVDPRELAVHCTLRHATLYRLPCCCIECGVENTIEISDSVATLSTESTKPILAVGLENLGDPTKEINFGS